MATFATYKQLASQGNGLAGCRLAAQLQLCRNMPAAERDIESTKALLAEMAADHPRRRDVETKLSKSAEVIGPHLKYCAGVPAEEFDNVWQYQLAAAQTGNIAAMTSFVVSPPLDVRNVMADMEKWTAYKQLAPGFLERAAAAGNLRAIEWLRAQMVGGWTFNGGALMPPNAERAVMLSLVLDRFPKTNFTQGPDRQIARLTKEIGPDGVARATALADDFYRKAFPAAGQMDARETQASQLRDGCDGPVNAHLEKVLKP